MLQHKYRLQSKDIGESLPPEGPHIRFNHRGVDRILFLERIQRFFQRSHSIYSICSHSHMEPIGQLYNVSSWIRQSSGYARPNLTVQLEIVGIVLGQ